MAKEWGTKRQPSTITEWGGLGDEISGFKICVKYGQWNGQWVQFTEIWQFGDFDFGVRGAVDGGEVNVTARSTYSSICILTQVRNSRMSSK